MMTFPHSDPTKFSQRRSAARLYALAWVAVALVGTLAPLASEARLAIVAGSACAVMSISGAFDSTVVRIIAPLAMFPAVLTSAPAWVWVLAGGVALVVATAREAPLLKVDESHSLQRHLELCRRRAEAAHLVCVRLPPAVSIESTTAHLFRVTDSVAVGFGSTRTEILAMVDDRDLNREGLERRLTSLLGTSPAFGWASFPEDGVTVEALVSHAREATQAHDDAAEAVTPFVKQRRRKAINPLEPRTINALEGGIDGPVELSSRKISA